MSNLIGRNIGVYHIEKKIGEGGASDVFLAQDTANNRPVALKVLRLEHHGDPKKIERFWISGHGARQLRHPFIVPVYDAGVADSRYYVAMEYMEGQSIEDLLQQQGGPLPCATALHYLDQIAEAVDYAHSRGVIHRDIKPSNILLTRDRQTARLTDFGIALLTGQKTVTESGALTGTPEFISPEQIRGQQAGPRSDVYSLGITAYQMMTGKVPFEGQAVTVLYSHLHTPPPSVTRLNSKLPPGVAGPIKRALAKEPQRRYPTAKAFSQDLRRAVGRRGPAVGGGPHAAAGGRVGVAVVGLLALLAIILAGAFFLFRPLGGGEPTPNTVAGLVTPGDPPAGGPTSTLMTIGGPTSTAGAVVVPATDTDDPPPPPTRTAGPPPTPSATATPTAAAAPRLVAPFDGSEVRAGDSVQTFVWEWGRALGENEHIELRFYRDGGAEFVAPFGWFKQSAIEVNLSNLAAGVYDWRAVVVRGQGGVWEADVAVSEPFTLIWGR